MTKTNSTKTTIIIDGTVIARGTILAWTGGWVTVRDELHNGRVDEWPESVCYVGGSASR